MTRKLFFLVFCFLVSYSSDAQDLLVTPKTTNDTDLIYHQRELFGSSFWVSGYKLSKDDIYSRFIDAGLDESIKIFKKGRAQNIFGNVIGVPAAVFLGIEISNALSDDKEVNTGFLVGSAVGTLVSSMLSAVGIKNMQNAVRPYNDIIIMEFKSTQNGIGMVFTF